MAINNNLPGVKVTILINGRPATEYEDPTEEITGQNADKTVVRYIESISEATFEIESTIDRHYNRESALSFHFLLDGKYGARGICFENRAGDELPTKLIADGAETGVCGDKVTVVPFKFSEIELTNDINEDQVIEDLSTANDLREIEVSQHRVNISKIVSKTQTKKETMSGKAEGLHGHELGEKVLKGRTSPMVLPTSAVPKSRGIRQTLSKSSILPAWTTQLRCTSPATDLELPSRLP